MERVTFVANDDKALAAASERARASFKYFWRELSWERRRIVPGLGISAVKLAFRDGETVEHMWLGDVTFDGREVGGVLLNRPNWLTTVKPGDAVSAPLGELGDWMYESQGRVFGGFTIDATRAKMTPAERRDHDRAWGLPFAPPGQVQVDRQPDPDAEHPMSENIAATYRKQFGENRSLLAHQDDRGWTLLHELALAGSAANVQTMLELGADRTVRTPHGMTARELAASLGWSRVTALIDYIEPLVRR
jgi:uncharacterized protein YegJ (DUF2314 family)